MIVPLPRRMLAGHNKVRAVDDVSGPQPRCWAWIGLAVLARQTPVETIVLGAAMTTASADRARSG